MCRCALCKRRIKLCVDVSEWRTSAFPVQPSIRTVRYNAYAHIVVIECGCFSAQRALEREQHALIIRGPMCTSTQPEKRVHYKYTSERVRVLYPVRCPHGYRAIVLINSDFLINNKPPNNMEHRLAPHTTSLQPRAPRVVTTHVVRGCSNNKSICACASPCVYTATSACKLSMPRVHAQKRTRVHCTFRM